jgi:pimeloyl-ACP methyl ester carboxylesterase
MAPLPSPFILVPGAGGDGWYWSRVAPLLRAAGHDATVVDLPAGDERAGLSEYADVIVEAIDGRSNATVVAQSMGAISAPLAVAWPPRSAPLSPSAALCAMTRLRSSSVHAAARGDHGHVRAPAPRARSSALRVAPRPWVEGRAHGRESAEPMTGR